jgi:biopolymer transport protein ExbB
MIFIGIASVACVAVIVERFMSLKRDRFLPPTFMADVEDLAREKKTDEIVHLCRGVNLPLARMVVAGVVKTGQGKDESRHAMELAGKQEVTEMEKFLDLLATIAAVSPLLGLLGTVTGMIDTFAVVRTVGVGDPLQMSGGISEALISTAGGLVVAIPALFFHRFFIRKVDRIVIQMEAYSERVLGFIFQ